MRSWMINVLARTGVCPNTAVKENLFQVMTAAVFAIIAALRTTPNAVV